MRILALYLNEFIEQRIGNKKQIIEKIPGMDAYICTCLTNLGHKVDKKVYNPSKSLKIDKKYDVIFNLCDGLEDDMNFFEFKVLKDLEKTGIPFTGNKLKTIQMCNDKRDIKKTLVKNNIPTPKFQIFTSQNQKLKSHLTFPLIVKPVCSDAAVGIYADSVVKNKKQLKQKIQRVLKKHEQPAALVEEYISGRDLVIPVMGKKNIKVLPPSELKYIRSYKNRPKILSYAAKWSKKKDIYKDCITLTKNPNKRFTKKELQLINSTAKKVYKAMGCSSYATVDARLDKNKNIFVIEINPNCWIGKNSDTAISLKKNYNISYPQFLNKLLKIAKEK